MTDSYGYEIPEYQEPTEIAPCGVCGRTFNQNILVRHERICEKAKKSLDKRKPFDSFKQRIRGSELQNYLSFKGRSGRTPSPTQGKRAKKVDWRKKHESFVKTIQSTRIPAGAAERGAPPQPSTPDPDYVQCPYCDRRFQEYAADRHIPFCKEQQSRIDNKTSSKAKEKLNKRVQYKPPPVGRKKSTNPEGEYASPPAARSVKKISNFSGTYTVHSETTPSKIPLVKATRPRINRKPPPGSLMTSKPIVGGVSSRIHPGNTPSSHFPQRAEAGQTRDNTKHETPFKKCNSLANSGDTPILEADHGIPLGSPLQKGRTITKHTELSRHANPFPHPHHVPRNNSRNNQLCNGYLSESDEQGHPHNHHSSGSCKYSNNRETANGMKHARLMPLDSKRHPSSPPRHEEIKAHRQLPSINHIPKNKGLTPLARDNWSGGMVQPHPPNKGTHYIGSLQAEDHSSSRSSMGGSAGHRLTPLNTHGMTMSNFCYECGSKFPVPQAKFCCECGTRRI